MTCMAQVAVTSLVMDATHEKDSVVKLGEPISELIRPAPP